MAKGHERFIIPREFIDTEVAKYQRMWSKGVWCGQCTSLDVVDQLRKLTVLNALVITEGNVTEAAAFLGTTRQELYRLMDKVRVAKSTTLVPK